MKFYTKNKFSFPAKFSNLTFPLFPMNFSYMFNYIRRIVLLSIKLNVKHSVHAKVEKKIGLKKNQHSAFFVRSLIFLVLFKFQLTSA